MSAMQLESIPEPVARYVLGDVIGTGIYATVYEATDTESGNRKVAIKVQRLTPETEGYIQEEYRILNEFSEHPNLPDFYGVYKNKGEFGLEIWFVMELCEGGSVMDIVRALYQQNRRMAEEHIAFVLKETTKALLHLHKNHVIHRDVCGNNILLTKEGEVKLVDFGLAREIKSTLGKRGTCIGSACWMAPEVVASAQNDSDNTYGARADVWALGITAIELGDGSPPFHGMHPTRAMFQIVRNPPPNLYRPANWSELYNDFISECLEKNPEYRPYMEEIVDHPFLTAIPDNYYYLTCELKKICEDILTGKPRTHHLESTVRNNLVKTSQDTEPEQMYLEDIAAIENANEEQLLAELKGRMSLGFFQTFIGDVLLILNPNETQNIYDTAYHVKYNGKSQSENPPHVFAIADRAYQDMLHHEIPQYILLSGESGSGKTTAMKHALDHLLFIGKSKSISGDLIERGVETIHAFINASTPTNHDSTRCVIKTQITFGATGKATGAIFSVYQLEKWRISSTDLSHANFHILYYFYDSIHSSGQSNIYLLESDRNYRYLRIPDEENKVNEIRSNPERNTEQFETILKHLQAFNFNPGQLETLKRTLSAILNLGEVCFVENDDSIAEIENQDVCGKVAELLNVDEKKFTWALTNYCLVDRGTAVRRRNTCDQARDARDMLANTLYARLVDWVVSGLNNKMTPNRILYGEKYSISILDQFGFECFNRNDLEQILVNAFNEQMQYHYIQRLFAWEHMEQHEEEVPPTPLNYYDNKKAVDQLLGKTGGVLSLIDEASKTGHHYEHVLDSIDKSNKNQYVSTASDKEFCFSHYTGTVIYDVREMSQKNREFLPPEMIDTLRLSTCRVIQEFFTNKLTKTGSLLYEAIPVNNWTSGLVADQEKTKQFDVQFSQTKHMRTAIATFRVLCLDILRELSIGAGVGGTHFIRCIRTDLKGNAKGFQDELIRQQLRALSILDTARARQLGYPHRITFPEFLRRYKFLAFDFDENVDITKDNCRLLLVRLKMEGWVIGKTKVFLKYYNKEYLSRLYEIQVKKIVKIQAMMRAFLAKRNVAKKLQKINRKTGAKLFRQATADLTTEAAAALLIQKAYRGYNVRKSVGPLINNDSGQLDKDTTNFIRPYYRKWKNKSMFQVLLQYRSAKFQELINLSQQIHIFNQNVMHEIQQSTTEIDLDKVNPNAKAETWLGEKKPSVWKLPFRFDEIPYFNTEHLCEQGGATEDQENWDSPLQWRKTIIKETKANDYSQRSPTPIKSTFIDENLISMPYNRDPTTPITQLPALNHTTINSKSLKSPKRKDTQPASPHIFAPQKKTSPLLDRNFEGANQDFEFIRSPTKPVKLKRGPGNPIAELESIGRKGGQDKSSEDDPPFNFQGMLRKTNFQRASLKRCVETNEVPYSKVLKNKTNRDMISICEKEMTERSLAFEDITEEICSTELAPGMILEGRVTDL